MAAYSALGSEKLYFAFGSNLHLAQMAKRCPESRYIGFAKLHQHRFQINERGFANVTQSPDHQVEGLVYLISPTDEAKLDRNEGCPDKYQKFLLPIEIFTAGIDVVGRSVSELAHRLQSWNYSSVLQNCEAQRVSDLIQSLPAAAGQMTKALVYVSRNYTRTGQPRDEYIDRMNAGITDARKLGMSNQYITFCLREHIYARPLPNLVGHTTPQRPLVNSTSRASGPSTLPATKKTPYRNDMRVSRMNPLDPAWIDSYAELDLEEIEARERRERHIIMDIRRGVPSLNYEAMVQGRY